MNFTESIETVSLWIEMWENDQSEVDETSPCDEAERKVIKAAQVVLKSIKKLEALSAAVDDWSCDRYPSDIGECDLMIAIWHRDGDRTEPCPECDGECGEPCAPITAKQAIAGLLAVREQLKAKVKGEVLTLSEAAEMASQDKDYLATIKG